MSVHRNDEIEELWGESLPPRKRNWLWLCLKYYPQMRPRATRGSQGEQFLPINWSPPGFIHGNTEHELLFLLKHYSQSDPTIFNPIPSLKSEQVFIRESEFDWIGDDARKLRLCVNWVQANLGVFVPDAQARFGDRDYLICIFDTLAPPILEKQQNLSDLKSSWEIYSSQTFYLGWFKSDDEGERCKFAWECLSKRPSLRWKMGFSQFSNATDVQFFFDNLAASDDEKRSHVDHVKKLWSQKKYRERQDRKNVKQYNFVFTGDTNRDLNKLAKQLGVSRTEVLVQLIYCAAKYGMPLGPMSPPPSTIAR